MFITDLQRLLKEPHEIAGQIIKMVRQPPPKKSASWSIKTSCSRDQQNYLYYFLKEKESSTTRVNRNQN